MKFDIMGHSATSIQLQTEECLMTQSLGNVKIVPSLPFSVLFCSRESLNEASTQCDLPAWPITTNVATQCCLDFDISITPISIGTRKRELQQCTGKPWVSDLEHRPPSDDTSLLFGIEAVKTHLGGKPELSCSKGFISDNRLDCKHCDPSASMEYHASEKEDIEDILVEGHRNSLQKVTLNSTTKRLTGIHINTKDTDLCASLQDHPSSAQAPQHNNSQSRKVPFCSSSASSEGLTSQPTGLKVGTSPLHIKPQKLGVMQQDNNQTKQRSLCSPKKVCLRLENVESVPAKDIQTSKSRNVKKISVEKNGSSTTEKKNWYLKERFVQRDGKILYRCFRCDEEFERKVDLTTHKQNEHKSKAAGLGYRCSECGNNFKSASKYHSHMGSHDNRFRCQICSKVFMRVVLLKKHLRVVHSKSSAVICLVCGTCHDNQSELDVHIDKKHPSESGPLRAYSKECKYCLKEYVSENSFLKHVEFAPYKCDICLLTFSCNAKLKSHEYLKHKPQVCEYCGKSFDAFDNYRRHVKEFHSEKGVACPHCDKKFSVRSRMLVHVDVKHTPGLKYKCPECDYRAKNYASVSRHLRVKHRPRDQTHTHVCPICSKAFLVLSKLKVHLHTHAESKPFSCDSCGKGYTSKYRLTKHQKQNHHQTAVESFCHLCNVDLGSFEQFIEHMESTHNLIVNENSSVVQQSPVVGDLTSHPSCSAQGQHAHSSSLESTRHLQHSYSANPITLYNSNGDSHSSLQLPSYPSSEGVLRLSPSESASSGVASVRDVHHQVLPMVLHRSDDRGGAVSACVLAQDVQNVVCVIPAPCFVEPSVKENVTHPFTPVRNIQCASNSSGPPITITAPTSMPADVFLDDR